MQKTYSFYRTIRATSSKFCSPTFLFSWDRCRFFFMKKHSDLIKIENCSYIEHQILDTNRQMLFYEGLADEFRQHIGREEAVIGQEILFQ